MQDIQQTTRDRFNTLITQITGYIAERPLDAALEDDLNRTFPANGADARALFECCQSGVAEGWMCAREAGDIRFGRVIKPDPATCGFSVDVVDMNPIAGLNSTAAMRDGSCTGPAARIHRP